MTLLLLYASHSAHVQALCRFVSIVMVDQASNSQYASPDYNPVLSLAISSQKSLPGATFVVGF
jgi:hypothetical protein